MRDPNTGPDILARYVDDQTRDNDVARTSEEFVSGLESLRNIPAPSDPGKPDPSLAGKSTEELRDLFKEQTRNLHPDSHY